MDNINLSTKKIAFLGLMLSIIIIVSIFERMLPPIPFLPPNFKLGLSNIIVMYCLFFVGKRSAFTLVVMKSFFNMLMRGPIAGIISLFGGSMSIVAIILFYYLFKSKISYIVLSIIGAIFHNVGQLLAASILLRSFILFYYLPILLIFGVIMGSITGVSLKVLMPTLNRISKHSDI